MKNEREVPLCWESLIPPVIADPQPADGLEVAALAPLDCGMLWIDFPNPDFNTAYSLRVYSYVGESKRIVSRNEITFGKPEPGWPVALIVNGAPMRFDGVLDVEFLVWPFERFAMLTQTRGREGTIRAAFLTGWNQPASVRA